tara:strand:+ start:1114 stop:3126 length:2013 start_codon:yes stop_codon:yes gene_type:complete
MREQFGQYIIETKKNLVSNKMLKKDMLFPISMNPLNMKPIVIVLTLLIIIPLASAKVGHINLLAVQEETNQGSLADLYLELNSGKGRVFIETFPVTKADTQISTRFAKEVACNLLNAPCHDKDFVYTIRSGSYIIGGPSAGAAISTLTMALLLNLELNQSIALTGTINSGGYIGPVSGIKAKIEAASNNSLKKVLIPSGTRFAKEINDSFNNNNNTDEINFTTIDLVEFGKTLNIEVKEVIDIEDALSEFTGKEKTPFEDKPITLPDSYQSTMQLLATKLCERTEKLQKDIQEFKKTNSPTKKILEEEIQLVNTTDRAKSALLDKDYYSAASYCFGANYQFRKIGFDILNLSEKDIIEKAKLLNKTLTEIEIELDQNKLNTMTDLQTHLIVKERFVEAFSTINDILFLNQTSTHNLAYAAERGYSAVSWSHFYNTGKKPINLNQQVLKESCIKKLSEAQERLHYTTIIIESELDSIQFELEKAQEDLNNERYALCLFKASKAKSSADVVLNNIGVQQDQLSQVIQNKLFIVRKNIQREINKGIFPILGYSYYEYASSLNKYDPLSALVYIEYATELSNFDMYFTNGDISNNIGTVYITKNELPKFDEIFNISDETLFILKDRRVIFVYGIIIGVFSSIAILFIYRLLENNYNNKTKPKKRSKSNKSKRKK